MKQILIPVCALMLAAALTACGINGNHPQPTDSSGVSASIEAENGGQADFSGTSASIEAESGEQADSSDTSASIEAQNGGQADSSGTSASIEAQNGGQADSSGTSASIEAENSRQADSSGTSASIEAENSRQIQITTPEGNRIVFQLNDFPAANSFYRQLPLSIEIEDYAGSEKIFYPPEKLDTENTPLASGPAGTLAYYAPWGNVAVFYGECGGASGLYALGEAVSGTEFIAEMTGELQMESARPSPALSEPARPENAATQQPPAPAPSFGESAAPQETESEISSEESEAMKMTVQVGSAAFSAALEENAASRAFVELTKQAPVVIQMSDYSGFEKVGSLGTNLPASDSQTAAQPGDIVLYNGNQIVIFYGSNSWSYTRLGKIEDLAGWTEALGTGGVTVTFSVN